MMSSLYSQCSRLESHQDVVMDREALLIVEVCMCVGICCFLEREAHIAPVYSAVYTNGD